MNFRQQLEKGSAVEKADGDKGWIEVWKKWEGEWIPRPIVA